MVKLKQVAEECLGAKAHDFSLELLKPVDDILFYLDRGNERFWIHATRTAIPEGTLVRLSAMEHEDWQKRAMRRMKPKGRKAGKRKTAKQAEDDTMIV